jgi:hypothetical protein
MTTILLPKTNLTAPYAPLSNALATLKQIRDRGLPNPVTNQVVERIGIPAGNVPRTILLLRFLDITDANGNLTGKYERLKRARSEEYQSILAEIILEGYGDVFHYVEPATASVESIGDAFRHYEPAAQRTRMVTLFIGLCEEAGIRPIGKRTASKPASPRTSSNSSRKTRAQSDGRTASATGREVAQNNFVADKTARQPEVVSLDSDYALLMALFQQLPANKKWSAKQRERWLKLFTANLDFLIEETDESTQNLLPGFQ